MKRLISLTLSFVLVLSTLAFAQSSVMYSASVQSKAGANQEFLAPGADGPIYDNGVQPSNGVIDTIQNTNILAEQESKEARLAELRARLAELRGEVPAENSIPATHTATNGIQSGYTTSGVGYGFARLAQNLSVKRGQTDFISATFIGDNRYEVVNKSANWYANGTFIVDVFGPNENSLKDGYQIWFALYDANLKRIGTAQAYHK